MKTISMKPAGTALNFRRNARISKFFANFGVQTVASMAFISFIAAALEAQTVAIAAAIIATATIGIINKPQKGGDHE